MTWPEGAALALAVVGVAIALVMPAASKGSAESEKVDRFVAAQIESRRVPGYAVAVVEGRRIAHARGFGTADQAGSPVTARTPFVLGSTSKSFTALAVMQLADEGRLDIGAPVGRYVSGLRLANRSERRITLRQLLNQTSGLPATAGGPLLRSVGDGDRAALLAELEGTRLWAEPGAAFQYSNANYVLLGMVVEEAAGMAYGEYVKTRIFDPLKMSDSFVSASAAKRSGLAVGHRYWFGFAVPHGPTSPEGIRAAGYLMSSAADMGRYLSMFLNDGVFEGRRLVSRQGLRTLLTPAAPATLGAWSGHQESEYAMGWFVGGPWREQAILHPGGTPDSSSMIVLLPKSRRAVVTLANANMELPIPGADGSTDRIARGVVSLLVGEQPEPGMSLNWFYVIFDLFVVVIIGLLVLSVTRLVRRVQAPGVARRRFSTYAGGIGELLLGLVLVAAPVLLGQGYAGMFLWTPDLALVLLVIGGLMSLAGALRVASGGRPRT